MTFIRMRDDQIAWAAGQANPGDSISWHPTDGSQPTLFDVEDGGVLKHVAGRMRQIHHDWPGGVR